MRSTIVLFALLFPCKWLRAQNVVAASGTVYIVLTSDLPNADYYYNERIAINSTQDVMISGLFTSAKDILISPSGGNDILIKPAATYAGRNTNDDTGGTTVIRQKAPGGFGRPAQSTVTLYPNPVATELNFNSQQYLINGYTVFNSSGAQILSGAITPTHEYTINVGKLVSGTYILKLDFQNSNQFGSMQFIKN